MANATKESHAVEVLDVIVSYLRDTARAHACAGWDCKICSINGERRQELLDKIIEVI